MFLIKRIFSVAVALGILAPALVTAADAERGGVLFDTCVGCHGSESYDNTYPTYKVPRLAGQWPEYLAAALEAYKSGERKHPTMKAQAASFSTEDMQDIAAYIASTAEFAGNGEAVGTAPDSAATCVACHGPAGQSIANLYPHLAGQHASYLEQAIGDYQSGARSNAQMGPLVQQLTEADIKAIAAFYSKQKGLSTVPK